MGNPQVSTTATNGILIDRGLVDALLKKIPVDPNSLVTWNGTEAVTAVLSWYWKQANFRALQPEQIPYYRGTGQGTFAYRNVKARATLESTRNIVNLGWFINEAIAAYLGIQHQQEYPRVANVSEWTQLLSLATKTCRIATHPVDNGDDSGIE